MASKTGLWEWMARIKQWSPCVELSILRIFPSQDKRRQVVSLLRSVQGPIQAEPDCAACRICEEVGQEGAILYLEGWRSREQFERHVRSNLYRNVLEAMELSRIQPEIEFHRVLESRGMEVLEALRAAREQEAPTSLGLLDGKK